MKKMMFLSKNWYFSVQKALIYYTVNKSHHNLFIYIPRRKSVIYWIQVRRAAAAAVEISLWTR